MAKIKDLMEYMQVAKALNINLALVGAHGRAKTAFMEQYADAISYELFTINGSMLEPTDTMGLPRQELNEDGVMVTVYSHPDWLTKACNVDRRVVLFFDEFTCCDYDVMKSFLTLLESRQLDGKKLAPTTQIVLAMNPPEIAPDAKKLHKATRDRLCMIPIVDDFNTYNEYYQSQDMTEMTALFDKLGSDIVPNYDESVINFAYDNAEFTWRSLSNAYRIMDYCVTEGVPDSVTKEMVLGYGGKQGAPVYTTLNELMKSKSADFRNFLKNAKDAQEICKYLIDQDIVDQTNDLAAIVNICVTINDVRPDCVDEVIKNTWNKEVRTAFQARLDEKQAA